MFKKTIPVSGLIKGGEQDMKLNMKQKMLLWILFPVLLD